ncbi:protein Spindly [Condylostylus longicornis]|uniref:protein Spindly n=1 Tax=Condylostylus longicornis TaxID=2530218 RepID=UPI00244E271F|nr:protein Spindly [Condylostylus longicornis]
MDLNISDINSLAYADLQEEYKKLFLNYQNLNKIHESDLQQIYELERNIKISKAAEEHLAQELEIISNSQNGDLEKSNKKLNQEIEELRRKLTDLEDYIEILEKKLENSNSENNKLQEKLYEISAAVENDSIETNQFSSEQQEKLEIENLKLLAKLNEFEDEIQKSCKTIAEKEILIEVLKEEIQCYQENLCAKRTELEEKTTLLESQQERINELNTELTSLKLQQGNENVKGNSLFAEVDDQRQEMKSRLLSQKKIYLEMKKVHNESLFEIRRLKRENSAMQAEAQACVSIFLNSKKFYEDKLLERISFLSKQNEELERKLSVSQDRLLSLAEKNEITWLDSMMTFCRSETTELKKQLQNIRLQKGIIEKHYRDSQTELAKWRFEALKLRCILIDRESLLEQNSIKFEDSREMNVKVKEDIAKSVPQILWNKNDFQSPTNTIDLKTSSNKECNSSNNTTCSINSNNSINTQKQILLQSTFNNDSKDLNDKDTSNKIRVTEEEFSKENSKLELSKIFETKDNSLIYTNTSRTEQGKVLNFKDINNTGPTGTKLDYVRNSSEKKADEDNEKNLIFENKFDKKSVKFPKDIENKVEDENKRTMKVISKRTKSNITIKKIIIKSKDDKL